MRVVRFSIVAVPPLISVASSRLTSVGDPPEADARDGNSTSSVGKYDWMGDPDMSWKTGG